MGDLRAIDVSQEQVTNIKNNIITDFEILNNQFKDWLNSDDFGEIKDILIANARNIETIFIQTIDTKLQMLPWDELRNLSKQLAHVNVAMLNPSSTSSEVTLIKPIQILVILALENTDDPNIPIMDRNIIETHLPDANIRVLPDKSSNQPLDYVTLFNTIEEFERLDVIVFVGHSKTTPNFTDTRIYITPDTFLTIDALKGALKTAVAKKLKLIIFNSCDGLGIVRKINDLQIKIPYLIVMREPIHNHIAQQFLNKLLRYFSNGDSLDESLIKTRDYLSGFEPQYPNCASLPLLFYSIDQAPLVMPTSEDINSDSQPPPRKKIDRNSQPPPSIWDEIRQKIKKFKWIILSFIVALLVIAVPIILSSLTIKAPALCKSGNQAVDNYVTCGEKSVFDDPSDIRNPEKRVGIQHFSQGMEDFLNNKYGDAQQQFKRASTSLEQALTKAKNQNYNDPETRIFLNNSKILEELVSKKRTQNSILPIAVVLPLEEKQEDPYPTAKLTLQGIAYLQNQYNSNPKSKYRLLIAIANDNNNTGEGEEGKNNINAKTVATELVKRKPYAVIGHYGSSVVEHTKTIYQTGQIVLMSFSATATKYKFTNTKNNRQELIELTNKTPETYFFRVVSTTQGAAKALADDFAKKGIKNLNLFYTGKLYPGSFIQEFKAAYEERRKNSNNNFEYQIQQEVYLEDPDDKKITTAIEKAKTTPNSGIILCPNGFSVSNKTPQEAEKNRIMKEHTKQIIRENKGDLPLGGCNVVTLYKDEIFNPKENSQNLVVAVPWSEDSKLSLDYFQDNRNQHNPERILKNLKIFWNYEPSKKYHEESMRMALGYDSLKTVVDSLEKLQLPLKGNSSQLQQYLVNPEHTFQGITGEISFLQGSDRAPDTSALITPDCTTEVCDWKAVE